MLFKVLLLIAVVVTTTSAQTNEGFTSVVRVIRKGGEEEEVNLAVPFYGAELLPAARRHANNLADLVAMQRNVTPDCAVQPAIEGSNESDGCKEVVIQRLCESMAMVIINSLKEATTLAQNNYLHPRQLVTALTRAESAALDENDCGPRAKSTMNFIVRNWYLIPQIRGYLFLLDSTFARAYSESSDLPPLQMGDSRLYRLVHLIETLENLQPYAHESNYIAKEPTPAEEDALKLLPSIRLMELSTFAGVERRTYAELCSNLTKQMHTFAAGVEDIEGGLIVADSRWPQEVPEDLKRENFLNAILSAVENFSHQRALRQAQGVLPVGEDPVIFRAMEVGFNGGHSAAITLSATEAGKFSNYASERMSEEVEIHLTAFDICDHIYTRPNADVLMAKYPNRFNLVCGDSQKTLPTIRRPQNLMYSTAESVHGSQAAPGEQRWASGGFNFAFVDGLHTFEGALSDLCQAWRLAAEGATVVVDDCDLHEVANAWAVMVNAGAVWMHRPGIGWRGLCVGRWLRPPPPPEELAATCSPGTAHTT